MLIHLRYTYQPGLADDLEEQWEGIVEAFGTSLNFVIAGLGLLVLLAVVEVVVPRRRRDPLVPHPGGVRRRHPGGAVLELPDLQRLGRRADAGAVRGARPRRPGGPGRRRTSPGGSAWCSPRCGSWWSAALGLDWSLHEGSRILPKQKQEVERVFAALPARRDRCCRSRPPSRSCSPAGPTRPAPDVPRSGWRSTSTTPGPAAWRATPRPCATRAPTVVAVGRGARYPWLMPDAAGRLHRDRHQPGLVLVRARRRRRRAPSRQLRAAVRG